MGCGRESTSNAPINESRGCVCEVVRAILDIQNQAVNDDCSSCTTNCFLEPLGGIVSPARTSVDTRVFTLLNKDGSPFMANFSNGESDCICTSIYFRVEDVFSDCCATLRVLIPENDGGKAVDILNDEGTKYNFRSACSVVGFEASESCITVDLSCFCAVQCIADVDLGICN